MTVSDPASVWWEQVGSSLRLLRRIERNMEDGVSAVLHAETEIPWKERFYECVNERKELVDAVRMLRRLTAPADADPGEYVLEHLCPEDVRADYYPGVSCAQFLGSRDDLVLCDSIVWVDGIRRPEALRAWMQFVNEYERASADGRKAVFFLEYVGPAFGDSIIDCIEYRTASADCRVLCLELSDLPEEQMELQIELAVRIGGKDPELAAALTEKGGSLTEDPGFAAKMIWEYGSRSDGTAFERLTDEQTASAVKYAEMIVLFPIIEQKRVSLIAAHEAILLSMLPVRNSYGEEVTDPRDIEIGTLKYMAGQKRIFSAEEMAVVNLCRRVRNRIAHNDLVDYADIQTLLGC